MKQHRNARLIFLLTLPVAALLAFSGAPPTRAQNLPRLQIVSAVVAEPPRLDIVFAYAGAPDGQPFALSPDQIAFQIDSGTVLTGTLALSSTTQPLDVAVVADLSAAMGDLASPPDRTRLQELAARVRALTQALPPDTSFSLTTFDTEAHVAFSLQPDGGGLLNTLDQLVLRPPTAEAPGSSYPLVDALHLGLSTLTRPTGDPRASAPAALVLFAAGRPALAVDPAALREVRAALAAGSPLLTVVALGGDQPGEFRDWPGGPESLRKLADGLDASFVPLYSADSAEAALLAERLQRRYDEILNWRKAYKLSVELAGLDPGEHTLRLEIAGLAREARFRIPELPAGRDPGGKALLNWPVLAGALLLVGLFAAAFGGALIWRRRRPARQAPTHEPTRRRRSESGLRSVTRRGGQAGAPLGLRIAVVEGDTPRTLILSSRECMIGRDPQADISLTSDEVSWNHAVLSVVQAGVLQLVDLHSANGTFVGPGRTPVGEASSAALRAGDCFWVGPVCLVVEAVA